MACKSKNTSAAANNPTASVAGPVQITKPIETLLNTLFMFKTVERSQPTTALGGQAFSVMKF
jgi:hypothetical protein